MEVLNKAQSRKGSTFPQIPPSLKELGLFPVSSQAGYAKQTEGRQGGRREPHP